MEQTSETRKEMTK